MRTLKISLIILLISVLAFGIGCKTSLIDPDDIVKFAYDIEITYERPIPFGDNKYLDSNICLYVGASKTVKGWGDIEAKKMEKIATDNFKYVAWNLPVDTWLWIIVQDMSQDDVGGEEFNARIIRINGIELTDLRNDPWGNDFKAAYFRIDADEIVMQ